MFSDGRDRSGIQCPASVLKIVLNYGQAIFDYYDHMAPVCATSADKLARGTSALWSPLGSEATRAVDDEGLAAGYLDRLLRQRMTGHATKVWASDLGRARERLPGFQFSVPWRFREPVDPARLSGLEDDSGARRGDGEGCTVRQKRPIVMACFVPGNGSLNYRRTAQTVGARTAECVFQAYLRDRGEEVPDSGGHTSDSCLGLPHAVMEVRQQDRHGGVDQRCVTDGVH